MRPTLRSLKRHIGEGMKTALVAAPLPLGLQQSAINRLLPIDPWPKSLAYQQCLVDRVVRMFGTASQSGPFQGMICLRDADEGCLVPKLLGCYEEELTSAAESLIQKGFDRIIDVGCASGYWLTGFALRAPNAKAYGFDIDERAKARCAQLNALNNVQSRVELFGGCTPAQLEELITESTLVFMDCDGPEYYLLDPVLAPALRIADIIVECHDYLNPQITLELQQRFTDSHAIEKISSRTRQPSPIKYPGLTALPSQHWVAALDERRPCTQNWLVMRSRRGNAQ
jgi:precorrin-6B methylase 2